MARIIAIDYGKKRTGIAVTDPLQIIATGLTTVDSENMITFLKKYLASEDVEEIVIGVPTNWDESETHGTKPALKAIERIRKTFPLLKITEVDERFTSKMAKNAMIEMGMKKKDRRDKKNVDEIAATIILQEYLQSKS